jgi:hypothetical protein
MGAWCHCAPHTHARAGCGTRARWTMQRWSTCSASLPADTTRSATSTATCATPCRLSRRRRYLRGSVTSFHQVRCVEGATRCIRRIQLTSFTEFSDLNLHNGNQEQGCVAACLRAGGLWCGGLWSLAGDMYHILFSWGALFCLTQASPATSSQAWMGSCWLFTSMTLGQLGGG